MVTIAKRGLCALLAVVLCAVLIAVAVPKDTKSEPYTQALNDAAIGLDEIGITAVYDDKAGTFTATQRMHIYNRFEMPLDELVLRTYANAFLSEETSPAAIEEMHELAYPNGFSKGGIEMTSLSVNGNESPIAYDDSAKTVLKVPFSAPLEAGQAVILELQYVMTVPDCRYRFGKTADMVVFGNVFPILAAFEDGAFQTREYYPIGDPFVSDCANYTVEITLPRGLSAQGTGLFEKTGDSYTAKALAVREFGLVLLKGYQEKRVKVDGVVVLSLAKTAAQAQNALDTAKRALAYFSDSVGPYPYPSLTVTQAEVPFSGMEYPQLVLVARGMYNNKDYLERIVAHETAHQWFYGVVGSDQYSQPWQDEALCEYLVYNYLGHRHGNSRREDAIFNWAEASMRVTVPRGVTPGSPIEFFGDMNEYSLVVYNRGSAMLVALETAIGREGMDAFLQEYYRRFAFKRADRTDFEQTLLDVCGQDYSELIKDYLDTHIAN